MNDIARKRGVAGPRKQRREHVLHVAIHVRARLRIVRKIEQIHHEELATIVLDHEALDAGESFVAPSLLRSRRQNRLPLLGRDGPGRVCVPEAKQQPREARSGP